jgi:peptide/nickel transport system permease protein
MTLLRRVPTRLVIGVVGFGVIAMAVAIGPFLLGPQPWSDPVHAALAPPASTITTLTLADGRQFASHEALLQGSTWTVSGGRAVVDVEAADVVTVDRRKAWLGTDRYGRDLLRLMLVGGRISLAIALLGGLVALVIGSATGIAAATGGRIVDGLLMRGVDAMLAFPSLLLLILAASVLDPGAATIIMLLGLTSWMGLARLVRGQVLSVRERPFVLSARVSGTPWYRMWAWHFFPEVRGPVAQDVALRLGDLVLAEATLSYLGLGLPPTTPTWGLLVNEGHRVMLDAWWLATIPGLAIATLVTCFALIGDGLQEV